jgi:hypothetical protein
MIRRSIVRTLPACGLVNHGAIAAGCNLKRYKLQGVKCVISASDPAIHIAYHLFYIVFFSLTKNAAKQREICIVSSFGVASSPGRR